MTALTLVTCQTRRAGSCVQNRTVDAKLIVLSDLPAQEPGIGVCGQALGLLVPVSCTPCGASTSGLSTRWSGRGPYPHKGGERPHLEASFPLRCFQRLSLPNVANQQCTWRYNWHTRGSSVPVLSY